MFGQEKARIKEFFQNACLFSVHEDFNPELFFSGGSTKAKIRYLKDKAKDYLDNGRFTREPKILNMFLELAEFADTKIHSCEALKSDRRAVWWLGVLMSHIGNKQRALELVQQTVNHSADNTQLGYKSRNKLSQLLQEPKYDSLRMDVA